MLRGFVLLAGMTLAQAAQANTWQKCDMRVKITAHLVTVDTRIIEARVVTVASKPDVQCPKQGEVIRFRPESADYQSELARKRWPKVGRIVRMRYQYLDGICKNDGNEKPCRIEHHPMLF